MWPAVFRLILILPVFLILDFGYWRRIDMHAIQQVLPEYLVIHEEDHEDDDCGWLYHYVIKHKGNIYG